MSQAVRHLERRPEDVERATARTKEARTNNKARRTKRIGATPTDEDRGSGLGDGLYN